MVERLSEVEARRASIAELGTVTDAMRSLAAVRLQQATGMLDGTRTYAAVIADALARAVGLAGMAPPWPGDGRGSAAVLLFTPEHGFVGGFAEQLVDAAMGLPPSHALWVIGSRGVALLEERGRAVAWSTGMATQVDAVTATVGRAAEALYRAAARDSLGRVELLYGRVERGTTPVVVREPLLPLDLARFGAARQGVPPLTNLPPARLVERLVDEYVYALLAHAAMESFAAENAARLSVMIAARQHIDDTLTDLTGVVRRLRQEQITNELIELATGAAAAHAAEAKARGRGEPTV